MTSSTSLSSYPPVVPQHCSNVPVLFELLRGEEEQCRVWLRDEMEQIPDTLIDSLFGRFIMSSSFPSVVPHSRSTLSELCELLEGEKVETRKVLRGEMDRLVNTLFDRLTNKLRANEDLDRSEDGGDRAQVVVTLDRVESANANTHQPSSLIGQPSTSSLNPVAHQQHSNADAKSGKRKSQTESTNTAVKRIKPRNDQVHQNDEEEEETVTHQVVILEVNCTEPGCMTILESREMWRQHLSTRHGQIAFKQLKDNVRHNPQGQTEHACTNCQAVHKSQRSLKEHWKRYHQAGKFQCSVCGFVANLAIEVVNHHRKHHVEKKFQCTIEGCNKSFRTKHDLENHARDHNGERPYKCDWDNCEATFKVRSNATQHVRTQHFHLPPTVKEQRELNIIDTRDPQLFVQTLQIN